MTKTTETTAKKITTATKKPLYATVGAGEALYSVVTDAVDRVREVATADVAGRVEDARERLSKGLESAVPTSLDSLRQRLSGLPSELPDELAQLRDKLTTQHVQDRVDQYGHQLHDLYSGLAERGEEAVERLRATPRFEHRIEQVEDVYSEVVGRAEDVYSEVVGRAEEVIGLVSDQVNGLLGSRNGGTDSGDDGQVVDAEVVQVTTESQPIDEVVDAPRPKKTTVKKAAKKATAAKKPTPRP